MNVQNQSHGRKSIKDGWETSDNEANKRIATMVELKIKAGSTVKCSVYNVQKITVECVCESVIRIVILWLNNECITSFLVRYVFSQKPNKTELWFIKLYTYYIYYNHTSLVTWNW